MPTKAQYVAQEAAKGQSGGHTCHAEGCKKRVPPALLMCSEHWKLVPKLLQGAVWRHYSPGQEKSKRPSAAYLAAAKAAVEAVAKAEGLRRQMSLPL